MKTKNTYRKQIFNFLDKSPQAQQNEVKKYKKYL